MQPVLLHNSMLNSLLVVTAVAVVNANTLRLAAMLMMQCVARMQMSAHLVAQWPRCGRCCTNKAAGASHCAMQHRHLFHTMYPVGKRGRRAWQQIEAWGCVCVCCSVLHMMCSIALSV
jgi:hypothetical protein